MPESPLISTSTRIQQKRRARFFKSFLVYTAIAFIITLPIRFFVVEPYVVSGASMTPTFDGNDYIIIDKLTYTYQKPQRGDVIIFRYPLDPSVFYIKRIVGLPGETMTVTNRVVSFMGKDGVRHIIEGSHASLSDADTWQSSTTILAPHEYFVLGDNRDASSDSREWGPLQEKFIVGRALVRLFPFSEIGLFPGVQNSSITP